jgi:two-component system OmpR family response regulator
MLTSRDSTQDVVRGLNAGADDYLTKPFALEELLARVNAITRRQLGPATGILRYQDLEMDRLRRLVKRAGKVLDLSPREFRLLEFFLLSPERVVSRSTLLEKVWDMSFDPETNVVDAHISNLRKKLESSSRPRLIHTVRGAGYALRLGGAEE